MNPSDATCKICSERQAAEGQQHCCKTCQLTNGEAHHHDCDLQWEKDQADEAINFGRTKKNAEGAEKIHDRMLLAEGAVGDLDVTETKKKAWQKLKIAMRIDEESMKQYNSKSFVMGIVKVGFLAVIVGCELDLYAFIMSWPGYWKMQDTHNLIQGIPVQVWGTTVNFTVIKLLLLVGPVGYATAVIMYKMYFIESVQDDRPQQERGYAKSERAKIKLELYHFTPLLRYFLLIKDTEPRDIEGLFRVNALSTFTLGTAQIVCMLFHLYVLKKEYTIFVRVGIFTQCWNLAVTLLYFLTPLSAKMMAATSVDNLKHNVEQNMIETQKDVLDAVDKYSRYPSSATLNKKTEIASRIDIEMALLGGLATEKDYKSKVVNELSKYEVDIKVEALSCLRRIQYLKFAQIGQ